MPDKKRMSKEEFRERLVPAIGRFMEADAKRGAALDELRELVPWRSDDLVKILETPPDLCASCGKTCSNFFSSEPNLCSPCKAIAKEKEEQARIEARARELVAAKDGVAAPTSVAAAS